jgi:DinB superfamily
MRVPRNEAVTDRHAPGKWSKKEILGHLLDSASNNHQRFVRAQLGPDFCFPNYEQEAWVRQQAYGKMNRKQLVELWRLYNLFLAHTLERISKELLSTPCKIGTLQAVPLPFLVTDYLNHLSHHLGEMVTQIFCMRIKEQRLLRPLLSYQYSSVSNALEKTIHSLMLKGGPWSMEITFRHRIHGRSVLI